MLDAAKYKSFCIDVEARNTSGNHKIQRCVRYSDDGYDFDTATSVEDWITSAGYHLGGEYTDIPDGKNYAWIGIETLNTTSTDVEQGRLLLTIKLKHR